MEEYIKEYISRHQRLQKKMIDQHIDAIIITQNVDLYYFTASMQTGFLFIPSVGEAVYYVRRSLQRAQEETTKAVEVVELGSMKSFGERLSNQFPQVFRQDVKPMIATEFDVLPVQVFRRLESAIPGCDWADGSLMVREVRMIKSATEVAKIKEAAQLIDLALEHAITNIKEGMRDVELMSLIETYVRERGHLGLMRMRGYNQEIITGMVGSGVAAAVPTYFDGPAGGQGLSAASPQSAGHKRIARNEPVIIDIGCCVEGYVIDQTRTLVIGELNEEIMQAYEVSESILHATEGLLKPGTICESLYINALEMAEQAGLSKHFMGHGSDQVKFLGHGIGLEIDELPVLAKGFKYPLEAGMVIAIEPKFTYPGVGVVGIENSYLITDTGFEKLTCSREGLIKA